MIRFLKILWGCCAALYPLLIYWLISSRNRMHLQHVCLWMLPVLAAVCVLLWYKSRQWRKLVSPGAALVLFAAVAWTDALVFFKLYPILISSLLLTQFASTLVNPPSMVERFARLAHREDELPAYVAAYCRKVTWIWVVFFCFNIAVSAWTAWLDDWQVWTLYNGCISYILIGILMGGEWVVRRYVQKRQSDDS